MIPKRALRKNIHKLRGKKIAVVYGASSMEDAAYMKAVPRDEWSLSAIMAVLNDCGLTAEHIDPTEPSFVDVVRTFDIAFLNTHGPYGEDGRLQGLLDYLGIPYTCSGVLASSIGMDKLVTKAVFRHLNIRTPPNSGLLDLADPVIPDNVGLPAMLKAVDGGSSIGLERIKTARDLSRAIRRLVDRGFHRCFLEEFVEGRSVTASVLVTEDGPAVLPLLECITEATFYDEETKLGRTEEASIEYRVPLDLSDHITTTVTEGAYALATFLDCKGALRVDYVIDRLGHPYALEINTIPGLQRHSNLPIACKAAGLTYQVLITTLLAQVVEDTEVLQLVSA